MITGRSNVIASTPPLTPSASRSAPTVRNGSTVNPQSAVRNVGFTARLGQKRTVNVRVETHAEADDDWPRKDDEHFGLERPGIDCNSASARTKG